jgi:hypothetical protein
MLAERREPPADPFEHGSYESDNRFVVSDGGREGVRLLMAAFDSSVSSSGASSPRAAEASAANANFSASRSSSSPMSVARNDGGDLVVDVLPSFVAAARAAGVGPRQDEPL